MAVFAIFGIFVGLDVGYTGALVGDKEGNDVGLAVFAILGVFVGNDDGIILGMDVGSAVPKPIG